MYPANIMKKCFIWSYNNNNYNNNQILSLFQQKKAGIKGSSVDQSKSRENQLNKFQHNICLVHLWLI